MPRALSISTALVGLLYVLARGAVRLAPPSAAPWVQYVADGLALVALFLPALWGRAPVPTVEPARLPEVARVGVVLLALSLAACEVREGYGAMLAVAIAAPVVVLFAGVLLGLGRRGPLVLAALLLALPARAEEPRPAAAPVPVAQLAPVVQPAPALPVVPPAALSPCEVCAGQIGTAIGKPPAGWPTWAKALVGLGAAAVAALQIARDAGAFPAVK